MTSITVSFLPEWASPPGETIGDAMLERSYDRLRAAELLSIEPETLDALLVGKLLLSTVIAQRLASVFGPSVDFWIRRENLYRQQLGRLDEARSGETQQWLLELPIADMIRFGWIERRDTSVQSTALACQRYFGVPDAKSWRNEYGDCLKKAAFRTSVTFATSPGAVAAWLRHGELLADEMPCDDWNPNSFRDQLTNLRALTRLPAPSRFIPELQQRCAKSGVAVIIARAPQGCRASGACKLLSPQKALLMLSFRYLSDDHFWFTFFHEAGHLLLHQGNPLHLEGEGLAEDQEEMEANSFAQNTLIPSPYWEAMLRLPQQPREIIRFATRLGVSPGIVVGQLQHQRRILPHHMNALKRRYEWEA